LHAAAAATRPEAAAFVPAAAFQAGENEWGRGGGLKDALFQLFDK
jgi:hypothetical protein